MSNATPQTAILNGIQSLVISEANANGINLAESFATVEEFKKFIIGLSIRGLVDAGYEFRAAFEIVMGEGSYESLANTVFEQLQSPA